MTKSKFTISTQIYYSQSIPLQWSKFRGTHFIFKNQLLITTSKFTEDWINETNRNRSDTILEVYKKG